MLTVTDARTLQSYSVENRFKKFRELKKDLDTCHKDLISSPFPQTFAKSKVRTRGAAREARRWERKARRFVELRNGRTNFRQTKKTRCFLQDTLLPSETLSQHSLLTTHTPPPPARREAEHRRTHCALRRAQHVDGRGDIQACRIEQGGNEDAR